MEIIIILLLVLLAISVRAYLRQRALAAQRLDKLNEKARKAKPPPEPTIIPGTGRRHPNGQWYFRLSDGSYGTCRDDGSVYSIPDEMYFESKPSRA